MADVNVSDLSEQEVEALEQQIAQRKARFKWRGKGGIYDTCRRIPLNLHKDSDMTEEEKKIALREQLETFIEERL